MTILDSRTSRVLFTALLFAVGFGFLYAARRTLILFLFAIFFAYLINPAVVRLEKLVRSRVWAITSFTFCFSLLWRCSAFSSARGLPGKAPAWETRCPDLMDKAGTGQFSGQIGQLAARIGNEHGWSDATQKRYSEFS